MYNILTLQLFRVIKTSIKRDFLWYQTIVSRYILYSYCSKCNKKYVANMSIKCFQGHNDIYNGVTIHSIEEPCPITMFSECLKGTDLSYFL